MDTTTTTIDTILHKIIADENIYQSLLTEQHETYEFMMYMFLGIIGLVSGISLFLNFYYFNKKIASTVEEEVAKVKETISNDLKKEFEIKTKEIEDALKVQKAEAKGAVLFLQGNNSLEKKEYFIAFYSLFTAAMEYSSSESKLNLIRILDLLINDCLPYMTKNEISILTKYDEIDFKDLISKLKDININGELHDKIRSLQFAYDNATKREPPVQPTT